ncbi:MAG: hypothetical protein K2G63_01635, partial [Oscillospiraceae bacterium]|nr:hypothetical protein [Oscillospiraceae bacterium]
MKDLNIRCPLTDSQKESLNHMQNIIRNSNIKVVSFSIFDTLVLIPFISDTDLFFLMENDFKDILDSENIKNSKTFSQIRVKASANISHLNIQDIYSEIQQMTGISKESSKKLMETEINLMIHFCCPRCSGVELLREAERAGKKIILKSNTYFSKDVIEKILKKCGITGYKMIFFPSGSEESGNDVYSTMIKRLKLKSYEMLHIGSDIISDVETPINQGIISIYLPSCREQLFKTGRLFEYIYNKLGKKFNSSLYFPLRCLVSLYGLYAFDYPSKSAVKGDFCGNPYCIGFIVLGGLYLYGGLSKDFNGNDSFESIIISAMRSDKDILIGENDFIFLYNEFFNNIFKDFESCDFPFRFLINNADDADIIIFKDIISDS